MEIDKDIVEVKLWLFYQWKHNKSCDQDFTKYVGT